MSDITDMAGEMTDTHELARGWCIPTLVELSFEAGPIEGMAELRLCVDAYLGHGATESLLHARSLVRRVCHWLGDAGFDWSAAHAPLLAELERIEAAILAAKGVQQ